MSGKFSSVDCVCDERSRSTTIHVCMPMARVFDKSEEYTRKPKARLVLGQEIPYSTFKEPAQGERYAIEFSLS